MAERPEALRLAAVPPAGRTGEPRPLTVHARFNWRTGTGLFSASFGLSWGAGVPWGHASVVAALVFLLAGIGLVIRSVSPSITFTLHTARYFERFGRTSTAWNLDQSSRLAVRQESYLNRLGLRRKGTLVLEHRAGDHWSDGLLLPSGRYGAEPRWAALLLHATRDGHLSVTPEAVDELTRRAGSA